MAEEAAERAEAACGATAAQADAHLGHLSGRISALSSDLGSLVDAVAQNETWVEAEMQLAQQWRSRRRDLQKEMQRKEDEVRRLTHQLRLREQQQEGAATPTAAATGSADNPGSATPTPA